MKKLLCIVFVLMLLIIGCEKKAVAQDETQQVPTFSLPFEWQVNTLWDFQHKRFTLGGSVDAISILDILYLGFQGVGAAEGGFFSQGLLGGQANVDVNKGVVYLVSLIPSGENKVKWLLGEHFPRVGYAWTYNFMGNDYYKKWNHFVTIRLITF